ncbi:MAG: GNAT family N-acetyltransferase [Sphingomonadaceae bacterium]|nr:GNAT family N-acetyltransferase [Sphingomonadaceae bacterium]
MTALHMRAATEADLAVIAALLADDVNGRAREDATPPLDPGYAAAFAAIDADPNQMLVVAESGGAVVGTMQLSFLPGLSFRGAWRGQIEAVRIASPLRGRGLGAAMIEWAVARCRERGCRIVQFTSKRTRTDAHRFYERLGFVASHVGMRRALD